MAYILLRNATPILRAASSEVFGFIGRCSLEAFILQYHLWLAAGTSWRFVNFVVVAAIFIGISHRMAHATSELTSLICDTEDEHRIPSSRGALPVAEQTQNPSGTSSMEADEEHIPLQETQSAFPNDIMEDKVREVGVSDGLEGDDRTLMPEEEESLRLEEGTWTSSMRLTETNSSFSLPIRLASLAFCMWVLNVTWPDPPPSIP
ncbi:16899_t:CDS:2 [Acaulospora colombiana]|uniref:16899_t:CDS:1 n=1 Tax=Acaulospora colombiana TaxID=27376 RepID=A0ACA9QH84_9GLOM|nr:16899_t:CDS:2 [Acaulospora colombiana]